MIMNTQFFTNDSFQLRDSAVYEFWFYRYFSKIKYLFFIVYDYKKRLGVIPERYGTNSMLCADKLHDSILSRQ